MASRTEPDNIDLPPPRPSLKAFGPFSDGAGVRLVKWELDYAECEMDVEPHVINGSGVFHGGAMSTLLDTCCAHAAIFCTVPGNYRSGATVTLTCNFIAPVRQGQRVIATGRKTGGGATMFMSVAEARDETGRIVATAQAVGRYRDGSGKPEGMKRPDGVAPGKSPQRFSEG
ncbi:MAG: PaaI family thioesterase [Alphaproteobacteria bacterium]